MRPFFVTEVFVSSLIFGLVENWRFQTREQTKVESKKFYSSLNTTWLHVPFFPSHGQMYLTPSISEGNLFLTSLAKKWEYASLSIFGRLRLMWKQSVSQSALIDLHCLTWTWHVCLLIIYCITNTNTILDWPWRRTYKFCDQRKTKFHAFFSLTQLSLLSHPANSTDHCISTFLVYVHAITT